jgi:hypothetical protein
MKILLRIPVPQNGYSVRRCPIRLAKLYGEAKAYIDGKWLTLAIASADELHDVADLLAMKRSPLPRG